MIKSLGLVDVNLYAIDKINIKIPEGRKTLKREIKKCRTRIPIPIFVNKKNLEKNIVLFHYFPWHTRKNKISIIKYKILHKEVDDKTGKTYVYGSVISVS